MVLDGNTLCNLEVLSSVGGGVAVGTVKGSLLGELDRTSTPMGRRLLLQWVATPLVQLGHIQERQQAVHVLCETPLDRKLRLPDLERLLCRIHIWGLALRDHKGARILRPSMFTLTHSLTHSYGLYSNTLALFTSTTYTRFPQCTLEHYKLRLLNELPRWI